METDFKNACIYENHIYPEGAEISGYIRSIVCMDRIWHDVDEGSEDSKVSLAYVYH